LIGKLIVFPDMHGMDDSKIIVTHVTQLRARNTAFVFGCN
jgi:hypothetical protein